jgi:flavin-dependent dehydrogenase
LTRADRFDVAVVGGGPAGCAAAIVLARHGVGVVLLERSAYGTPRIGETLPPEVGPLLDRLGAGVRFRAGGHLRSPGILAAWGGPEPYANDFIANPHGSGWRVDRARFDAMLAGTARDAGAVVDRQTDVVGCDRQPSGEWALAARDADGALRRYSAEVILDAAGTASPLARQLGATRVAHDRLVGVSAVLTPDPAGAVVVDRRALIEATEHGWWYSGGLPDGRLVMVFHTDAAPRLRERWSQHLANAPHTAARVAGREPGDVRIVAAGSRRRAPVASGTWLAAGDAAASHDPICGLGVYWAIESGVAAADAILARAVGDAGAVDAYARTALVRFEDYLSQRAMYYRAEQRWPESAFWRRRHGAAARPAGRR